VYLKLNCEGCECDVLDDLIDSGAIKQVRATMVLFDVRKIPSQKHREDEVRARLDALGIGYVANDWSDRQKLAGINHSARVLRWLESTSAASGTKLGLLGSLGSLGIRFRWQGLPMAIYKLKIGRLSRGVLTKSTRRRLGNWLSGYRW
jgi:hypothetical protein